MDGVYLFEHPRMTSPFNIADGVVVCNMWRYLPPKRGGADGKPKAVNWLRCYEG